MTRPTTTAALILILAAGASASTLAAKSHPFTARDLVGMDRITDLRVSPDGAKVAFTVSALDLDANRRRKDIWLVGIDGAGLRRLTSSEENDESRPHKKV